MSKISARLIREWVTLLGTIAKFASPETNGDAIIERYFLQSVARSLVPNNRIRHCHRHRSFAKPNIELLRSDDGKHATFGNLQTCCSVWDCSVCSNRISEVRRKELQQASNHWIQQGNSVFMLTYTLQHSLSSPLSKQIKALKEARRTLKSGKGWQCIKTQYNLAGSIAATEVTFGENGYHTHIHELVFREGGRLTDVEFLALKLTVASRWVDSLAAHGATASMQHGLDLLNTDQYIADYIAKFGYEPKTETWGMSSEITKAATRKESKTGITPRGLLILYSMGINEAGSIWKNYSRNFKGVKQLVWTKGLANLLGMEEIRADEKIERELGEDSYQCFARIEYPLWKAILNLDDSLHLRGKLLAIAKRGNSAELLDFLDELGLSSFVESGNLK